MSLYSRSKCSFTLSKLRFFALRKPKTISFTIGTLLALQSLGDVNHKVAHALDFRDDIEVIDAVLVLRVVALDTQNLLLAKGVAHIVNLNLAIDSTAKLLRSVIVILEVVNHNFIAVIDKVEHSINLLNIALREFLIVDIAA